jgi:hypothetical protein
VQLLALDSLPLLFVSIGQNLRGSLEVFVHITTISTIDLTSLRFQINWEQVMESQSMFARSWEVQLCLQPLNVGPLATLTISLSVALLSGFWSRRIGWGFGGGYSQDNVNNFLYTLELHDTFHRRPQWPGHTKTEMLIDGIGAQFPLFFRAAILYLPSFNLLRKVRAQITQVGRQVLREKIAAMKEGMDSGHDLYTTLCELSSCSCRVVSLTMGHAGENTSSSKGKLTDEEITEQTLFLLFAGQETTVLAELIYMYRSAHNILAFRRTRWHSA